MGEKISIKCQWILCLGELFRFSYVSVVTFCLEWFNPLARFSVHFHSCWRIDTESNKRIPETEKQRIKVRFNTCEIEFFYWIGNWEIHDWEGKRKKGPRDLVPVPFYSFKHPAIRWYIYIFIRILWVITSIKLIHSAKSTFPPEQVIWSKGCKLLASFPPD